MNRKRKPMRFMVALVYTVLIFFLVVSSGMYLSTQETERILEENLNIQVEAAKEEKVSILRNIYYTTRNILGNVMYDTEMYKILKKSVAADAQDIRTMRNRLRLTQTLHLNGIKYRIVLLDMNGNMYTNWLRGAEFYDEIMQHSIIQNALAQGDSFFLFRHRFWYMDDENPIERIQTISFGNVVLDQYTSSPIGILLFSAEEESLLSALESSFSHVMISDALRGTSICGSVDAALHTYVREHQTMFPVDTIVRMTWNNKQLLICRSYISSSSIEMLQVMDFDWMYRELIGLRQKNALLLFGMLSIVAVLLIVLSIYVSQPLRRVYRQVCHLNISADGKIPLIRVGGYRECAEVAEAINDMSGRTMEMLQVIQVQQKEKAELKYQYLISQLNPHFLLNTLNNVKWTAYMSNAPRVAEMITALGFLLETSLGKNQGEVTIEHEINHVRNYMLLQTMHYGNEITYSIDADESLCALPFERFTLQTLAGNAIKHGYVKGKTMKIDISITSSEKNIIISVRDNGCGIAPDRLAEVRKVLERPEDGERSSHIGLHNLAQRLSYRYGKNACITIDSTVEAMTEVTITVLLDALVTRKEGHNV